MKHLRVIDSNHKLIADNLKKECLDCFGKCNSAGNLIESCPIYDGKRRQGKVENTKCKTFLCCDTTKTTKLFREKLEALSYSYPDLVIPKVEIEEKTRQNEQKKVNRLVHNLSSIVGHNIQEIYDIVPQDVLALNWKNQLDYIEKEIKTNPKKAAMMFLRLAKNSIHMKSEFSIYRKLDREEGASLELRTFPLRTVLLNVLHTFFVDFSDNSVYVNVNDFYGRVRIDYETIQVAIYHLIENATKYVRHNSNIEISFEELKNEIKVHFDMTSTYVEPSERATVFFEGVSGNMAKKMKKNGDGIGMWRIKQMMELNGGDFTAIFGDKKETIMGYDFAENKFTLKFKKH